MEKIYNPVGVCIYCGAKDVELHLEHIMPYGLGGTLELPKASCICCERKTGAIEQRCLRIMFGDIRAWRGIKGRKHKHKYKPLNNVIEIDGKQIEYDSQTPDVRLDVTVLFAFHRPAILAGQPPLAIIKDDLGRAWVNASFGKNAAIHAKQTNPEARRILSRASFHPEYFAKMVAKIGYSYAVAEKGWGNFKPIIGTSIVGLKQWFPNYLVGGEPNPIPASKFQTELSLGTSTSTKGPKYLVARLRFFGDLGAPVYYAVVGEL